VSYNHENEIVSESCETDDSTQESPGDDTSADSSLPSTSVLGRRGYIGLLGAGGITSLFGSRPASASEQSSADTGGETDSSSGPDTEQPSGGFTWDETFTDTSWIEAAGDDLNVERVTTLESTGSGSITAAFDNASDQPTVIVFEVGGVIDLDSSENLRLEEDRVWIAGQTAPAPGIAITKGMFRIHGDECVAQHLSLLPGDQTDSDENGFVIDGDDVIFDHCTAMWGTDEGAGMSNVCNRGSFINNIIGEGLYDSIHSKGPHSRGLHINDESTDLCIMGNLFAHNNRRNPLTRADAVIANNYIYNHGRSLINFNSPAVPDVSSVSNVFEMGPDSYPFDERSIHHYDATLYLDDNVSIPAGRPQTDESQTLVDEPPIWPPELDRDRIVDSAAVPEFVLGMAGSRPADRPPVEQALIDDRVGDDSGELIDSQDEVGGYPDYTKTTRTLSIPDNGLLEWIAGYTAAVEQPAAADPVS